MLQNSSCFLLPLSSCKKVLFVSRSENALFRVVSMQAPEKVSSFEEAVDEDEEERCLVPLGLV